MIPSQLLIKRLNYKVNFIHTNEKWVRNNIILNQKKKHAKKGGYIFQDCLDICKISPSSTLIKKVYLINMDYLILNLKYAKIMSYG